MRLIPGKLKVKIELFKKITLPDIFIGAFMLILVLLVLISSLPGKVYFCAVIGVLTVGVLVRIDTVPNYVALLHILRHFSFRRSYGRVYSDEMLKEKKAGKSGEALYEKASKEKPAKKESKKESKKEENKNRKEREKQRKLESKKLKSKSVPEEEKAEIRAKRAKAAEEYAQKAAAFKESEKKREYMEDLIAFTGIKDNCIEYAGKYYGAAIEIPPVELRFFSPARRTNTIDRSLGKVLRTINMDYSANIVKIERPVLYDRHLDREYDRLDDLKASYENAMLTEEEYKARIEILYDRIHEMRSLCFDQKVVAPYYYLVLFESDKRQLESQISSALRTLETGEMQPHRLNTEELAVFLKYTNQIDFDEREIKDIDPEDYAQWAMPNTVDIYPRKAVINNIITYTMRLVNYPTLVGDAWLAGVMSMPGTKCVVKFRPMERGKAIRGIDRSLSELRGQMANTGLDSKRMELQEHIQTLGELLQTLQRENETLLETNIYVTAYDIAATRANKNILQPPKSEFPNISNMKKAVRRLYQESGYRLNNMEFDQMQSFIASQVSGLDPMLKEARSIPSNTLAACYPWIYAHVSDEGGFKLGSSEGVPVLIDFFRRDSERVNSNMVIVGKSGSGKSYATKSILENLASEDCKIFILDPENEYMELADNLHGKFINVGNAQYGRLNPFHIITALDDDEEDGASVSGSYATHLQFLEEFFRQILPDCDKDAMEYLNNMVDRMYTDHGITAETDLSRLKPEDYPIFDDLYDAIMQEFQQTDNEYIRSMLRVLMNYIAKFSTGGRNANIWNGPSTITTDENFTVFNFQSLLSNRNSTIANAQMLLVLKYIDNEIIKNRDYNLRYHLNRKIAVVIDEAHVFIDTKFPIALDFMFQLAKRIRKYNGMQIVITQNIKDFVGSEEIARKSTAIINACQYSMIFALAPNDIDDLCQLYEKAGGINAQEQEQITSAPRGQAFAIMSPSSRTSFQVDVRPDAAAMFEEHSFESRYFSGEDGAETWEGIVAESRIKRQEKLLERWGDDLIEEEKSTETRSYVTFSEIEEEEVQTEPKHVGFAEIHSGSAGRVGFAEIHSGLAENVGFQEIRSEENGNVTFRETGFETNGGVSFQEIRPAANGAVNFQETGFAANEGVSFQEIHPAAGGSVSFRETASGTNGNVGFQEVRPEAGGVDFRQANPVSNEAVSPGQAGLSAAAEGNAFSNMAGVPTGQPGVQQAAVPQASAAEQLLSELLGKFSYDTMVEEIRRTVREEVSREMEEAMAYRPEASKTASGTESKAHAEESAAAKAGVTPQNAEESRKSFAYSEEDERNAQTEYGEAPEQEEAAKDSQDSFRETYQEGGEALSESIPQEEDEVSGWDSDSEAYNGYGKEPDEASDFGGASDESKAAYDFEGQADRDSEYDFGGQTDGAGSEYDFDGQTDKEDSTYDFGGQTDEEDSGFDFDSESNEGEDAFDFDNESDEGDFGSATDEEDSDFDFADGSDAAEDEDQFNFGDDSEEDDFDDDDDDPFDIMELLAQQAEQIQDVNPIDMMITYDEEVIEVTLAELMQYNQAQQNR